MSIPEFDKPSTGRDWFYKNTKNVPIVAMKLLLRKHFLPLFLIWICPTLMSSFTNHQFLHCPSISHQNAK